MSGLFITGVGTGVGKTLVTTILGHQFRAAGRIVRGLKPVVSGFVADDRASDPALILRSLGMDPTPEAIAAISPWRFSAPVSPHFAARRDGRPVRLASIVSFCREQAGESNSIRLIEGAGGVLSPICDDATCLDLIAALGDPVILVTGSYLGAISHTLTALTVLESSGARVLAIVVSESVVDTVGAAETVEGLREFGAATTPIHVLPRLAGDAPECWRMAPCLTRIGEAQDG